MKSYAFNYSPQNQTFGQPFLYDGEHDFEYWKSINADALNYELAYDKEGRMVKNGNTTYEYTYPEDGVMMMTGYDSSHNIVTNTSMGEIFELLGLNLP